MKKEKVSVQTKKKNTHNSVITILSVFVPDKTCYCFYHTLFNIFGTCTEFHHFNISAAKKKQQAFTQILNKIQLNCFLHCITEVEKEV